MLRPYFLEWVQKHFSFATKYVWYIENQIMHIITTLKKSSNVFFIFHIFSIGLYFLWLMLFYLNRDHTNLDALKLIGIDFSLHVHLAIANKKMPYHVPVFLLKTKIFKFDCPSIIRYVSSTDTLENFPFLTKCSFF